MILFVHQPEYIPWLGFFDKLARCDYFIVYDDAQFQHGGFHNRNKIRTLPGWSWLTVPIVHNHPQTIKDVRIAEGNWRDKQLRIITHNYKDTPYFDYYFPKIEEVIRLDHEYLINLNLDMIKTIANLLVIKKQIICSSEFQYFGKEKTQKLVSMCKFFGADTYLAGSGGKAYMNENMFSESNIKIQWHKYEHPIYKQKFQGFQPNMSIIDLLFNMGPKAIETLLQGGKVSNLLFTEKTFPEPLML
jgi:hypothetical protein